ncbi:MAG: hypothetical protein H6825_02035 [Planctomycetes bacterium]|nr:hypothetical protein [Planctomycetota bacterium]
MIAPLLMIVLALPAASAQTVDWTAVRAVRAPSDSHFLWKGGVLVLADLADGTRRLAASAYGGYVLVDDARAVWRVDPADLAEWERLVLLRPLPDGATPETIVRAMKRSSPRPRDAARATR